MPTQDEIELERELARRKHEAEKNKPASETGGVFGKVAGAAEDGVKAAASANNWRRAAFEATAKTGEKIWEWLGPPARGLLKVSSWAAPRLTRLTGKTIKAMTCKKDEDGVRHWSNFNFKYAALNTAKAVVALIATYYVAPELVTGIILYSTVEKYENVFFPGTAVFHSSNYIKPNSGTDARRDESWVVQAWELHPDEAPTTLRFDAHGSGFFAPFYFDEWWYADKKLAGRINSMSPYGVKCDFYAANGFGARVKPFVQQFLMLTPLKKIADMRPQMFHIVKCTELRETPEAFFKDWTQPDVPQVLPALPAPIQATPDTKQHSSLTMPVRTQWNGDNTGYYNKMNSFAAPALRVG